MAWAPAATDFSDVVLGGGGLSARDRDHDGPLMFCESAGRTWPQVEVPDIVEVVEHVDNKRVAHLEPHCNAGNDSTGTNTRIDRA